MEKDCKIVKTNNMTLYISTPVNGRTDTDDFAEKLRRAKSRVEELTRFARQSKHMALYDRIISTFDLNPTGTESESEAMGRCIQAVIEADAVLMDWDAVQGQSRGCHLELTAARLYGKPVYAPNGSLKV